MPLPSDWVDRLFGRLSLRYGAAFLAQWPDLSVDAVKADWGVVLDRFDLMPLAIAHGLDYLPERPVNAVQFRNLCRGAPLAPAPRLEEPAADPGRVSRALAEARHAVAAEPARSGAAKVLDGIIERGIKHGQLSAGQRGFATQCSRMLLEDDPRRDVLRQWVSAIDGAIHAA